MFSWSYKIVLHAIKLIQLEFIENAVGIIHTPLCRYLNIVELSTLLLFYLSKYICF